MQDTVKRPFICFILWPRMIKENEKVMDWLLLILLITFQLPESHNIWLSIIHETYVFHLLKYCLCWWWSSLVAQLVKNPPAMKETWVWSLGWEDPLEKGTATHSSIFAWRTPWTEEPGSPWGHKESDMTEQLSVWW